MAADDNRENNAEYMISLNVTKIQRFSTHDGDGIRTVVFLKGCPLRCIWCHNPETKDKRAQFFFNQNTCVGCRLCETACKNSVHSFNAAGEHIIEREKCIGCLSCADACIGGAIEGVGREMTADEILEIVLRDKAFYGDIGGITVSGGEPMLQVEGTIFLLEMAKKAGITTAIETSGYFDKKYIEPLCNSCDMLIWDLKDASSERHKKYTGVSNERIIENILMADQYAKKILIRSILVAGVNCDEDNYEGIAETYLKMKNSVGVELIPYHTYGASKEVQLGGADNSHMEWIPDEKTINAAREYLTAKGVKIL